MILKQILSTVWSLNINLSNITGSLPDAVPCSPVLTWALDKYCSLSKKGLTWFLSMLTSYCRIESFHHCLYLDLLIIKFYSFFLILIQMCYLLAKSKHNIICFYYLFVFIFFHYFLFCFFVINVSLKFVIVIIILG